MATGPGDNSGSVDGVGSGKQNQQFDEEENREIIRLRTREERHIPVHSGLRKNEGRHKEPETAAAFYVEEGHGDRGCSGSVCWFSRKKSIRWIAGRGNRWGGLVQRPWDAQRRILFGPKFGLEVVDVVSNVGLFLSKQIISNLKLYMSTTQL
jgi:hypothetical protein